MNIFRPYLDKELNLWSLRHLFSLSLWMVSLQSLHNVCVCQIRQLLCFSPTNAVGHFRTGKTGNEGRTHASDDSPKRTQEHRLTLELCELFYSSSAPLLHLFLFFFFFCSSLATPHELEVAAYTPSGFTSQTSRSGFVISQPSSILRARIVTFLRQSGSFSPCLLALLMNPNQKH